MSFRTFFFDDTNYTSQNFAEYLGAQYNNGVFSANAFELVRAQNQGMFVLRIQPGKAVINGRMFVSDAAYTFSIDPAESGKARFDIIALRLNVANKTVLPVVLKGSEVSASGVSSSNLPPSPALTSANNTADGICDLALFKVYVTSSMTVITATSDDDGYDSDMRTMAVHPLTQALIDRFASESAATANFITGLSSKMNAVESAQTAETTARQNADTSLGNRITALETNAAKVKSLTPESVAPGQTTTAATYKTSENLVLIIVSSTDGVSSFIACRHGSQQGTGGPSSSYPIAGNRSVTVTFWINNNDLKLWYPSVCTIYGVYEIKAV